MNRYLFYLVTLIFAAPVAAQHLQITSPTSVSPALPSARDYATEVLNNPWDFDSSADLANYVLAADTSPGTVNVASGKVSVTSAGYFWLLSPGSCQANRNGKIGANYPIDTSTYRYLTVRMYSAASSSMKILVNWGCNYYADYWQSTSVYTTSGWHTYVIDLATIAHESTNGTVGSWGSGNATGIRIDPSVGGPAVEIDWVTLTPAAPADSHSVVHTAPSNGKAYSLFLDSDSDLSTGWTKLLVNGADVQTATSVTSDQLAPGSYSVVGTESNDWASLMNDPWDFQQSTDVVGPVNISGSFSGSGYTGTASNGNYFFINFRQATIPASVFRFGQLDLTVDRDGAIVFYIYNSAGSIVASVNVSATSGRHTYNLNLGALGGWSGAIGGIQVAMWANPVFTVHSLSIRNDGYGTTDLPSTLYESPAPLVVNAPPLFQILQPDAAGGEDFASAVLGDPWNMDGISDVYRAVNVTSPAVLPNNSISGVQGNYYRATSMTDNFDPHQITHFQPYDSTKMIDTSRYKNVVWRLLTDRSQDINEGSVVRIVWHVAGESGDSFYNGDDIITHDGWINYTQDMRDIILEDGQHPPGSYPAQPFYGLVDYFRVDPHEFSVPVTFYYDYIRVTADDESNTKYAITFDGSDADSEARDVTITFYATATEGTSGGSVIGSSTFNGNRTVTWDTTGVAEGTWYIYATATDGINSVSRKASGPVVVSHSRTQDSTVPVLSVSYPASGATLFDDAVVEGYALDNIQTAAVEVLIDAEYLTRIEPGFLDSTAQETYRSFAESGNAGFRKTIDLSAVSTGAHTMRVRATDTGGNQTVIDIPFVKSPGADPSPHPTPTPFEGSAIEVVDVVTPTPVPVLRVRPSLKTAKGSLSVKITGGSSCQTVSLLAATTKTGAGKTMKSKTGAATVTLTASKLKGLKKAKKSTPIYLYAQCGSITSTRAKIDPSKIRSSGSIAKPAKWVTHLKSKLK